MSLLEKLIPKFWEQTDEASGTYKYMFNFRRIWKQSVLITAAVALIPLLLIAAFDYRVTKDAMESEILLRTSRLVSNTRRTLSFFLDERRFALNFIIQDNTFDILYYPGRLDVIMDNLNKAKGEIIDLSLIDADGNMREYAGHYKMEGINYISQDWFRHVVREGVYISDVFLGFRNVPHFVIAIRHTSPKGQFYVLRASLDTEKLRDMLAQLEVSKQGDAFIINKQGILQTPSRYYGKVLEKMSLPVPEYSERTQVFETSDLNDKPMIIGYAYITDTPFILMIVKPKTEQMESWQSTRLKLSVFMIISITVILIVVLTMSTYLVNNIWLVDKKRVATLHHAEYDNKMASLGRLAAGVAHEINNPLAIINEKAGLISDLFTFKAEYAKDEKLLRLVNSIISSVERCAAITKRLLGFARHTEVSIRLLHLEDVINEVLGFLSKEAGYRSISVTVDAEAELPQIESDKGKLQQILLNLINNAFAAVEDGGQIEITVRRKNANTIMLNVQDNGCGIPEADIEKVFEPFFTTKSGKGGTGLGLSITYNLIHELGGTIYVNSIIGEGTIFLIALPIKSVMC
ncbi:MAG: two-component sensor histidine kinase [Desulfobacteraceae bacterium IS3]|nr:MAG: two-component sensor histidine kinase [Desulfobacteraceae bacterium IS3]HAO21589.1 two-component sensor histidine kinase [Desulfobacteraceae bacterium]